MYFFHQVYCMPCYEGPTKTTTILSSSSNSCSSACPIPNAATDLFKKTTMTLKQPQPQHQRGQELGVETPVKSSTKLSPPPRRQEEDYEDQTFPIIPYLASVVSLVCIAFVAFWGELLQLRIRKEKNRQVRILTLFFTWCLWWIMESG